MPNEWAGRCYEISLKFVSENREWFLVHGKAQGQPHAWCELDDEILDLTIRETTFRKDVYKTLKQVAIDNVYTSNEAIVLNGFTTSNGPWTDEEREAAAGHSG